MRKFISKLGITPSWFVLCADTFSVLCASLLSILIRDNFQWFTSPNFQVAQYLYFTVLIVGVRIAFFFLFRTSRIVVRYTNTKDIAKLFFACLAGTVSLLLANFIRYLFDYHFIIPTSILLVEFFITTFILVFYRLAFKLIFLETINPAKMKRSIVIFGAGTAGITTKRALDRDTGSKYNVVAFVDDDSKKVGKALESIRVISSQQLGDFLQKNEISFLIIAVQNLPAKRKNELTELALQYNVKVLIVPPVSRWINGSLSFKQIQKVKIEELLEREPIDLDIRLIDKELRGQTILVTGAAGSIGNEIVSQIMQFDFARLVLVDNAETPIFFLKSAHAQQFSARPVEVKILNICDAVQMEALFAQYQPTLVYHAAAYKHVPLMEENVSAAIKTNVAGTKLLADLAVQYGAKKFVMVSTDKAVNPTNVMGASKRIAEIYVQSLNFQQDTTKFVTTRFGNVLDSNGSVIPIFRKQIEQGGPLTVTHRDITRYFMTISEACQLVLTAGAMGNGGEIFIFDMGKSVKIYDLAKKMIKLSGLTLDKDIKIAFSGLRPGEKLYEELLANQENTIRTAHEKIMVAKVRTYAYGAVSADISALIALQNESPFAIVKKMKQIVPEFVSQNSVFNALN